MNTKKLLLVATIQSILFAATPVLAGDVEVTLPDAADAFTVDQPAGTELMRVNGDGHVGIGTQTPASQLDIYGATTSILTLRDGDAVLNEPGHSAGINLYDGNNTRTGFMGFGTNFEGLSIQNYNDGGGLHFSTGGNANQMVVTAAGSVGVNTISPSDGTTNGGQLLKLDVEGAVGATHYCDERGENCQTAASLAAGNTGTAMAFKVTSDSTAPEPRNTYWKMDNEWNPAPEINTFSNSTFANGTFTVGVGESGLYEIFASTNIDGDESHDYTVIRVNGTTVGVSSFNDSGAAVPSPVYAMVNLAEGDIVEVYGWYGHSSTDRPGNCNVAHCYLALKKIGAAATGGGTDNLGSHIATQNIDLAANKLVGNGGTDGIAIAANGNVGIGTATPAKTLHVDGSVQVDNKHGSIALRRNEAYTTIGHGNGVVAGLSPTSNLLGNFGFLNTTTDPDNPQGRFFIQTDTNNDQINNTTEHHFNVTHDGKVGIGTIIPRAGLDVANDAAIPLVVERTSTGGGGFVWQDFMADGNHQWRINGDSATGAGTANLKFSTNDGTTVTQRMLLSADGNVGIGVAAGSSTSDGTANGGQVLKLDVEGAVGASHYCDVNGENCVAAADLGSGSSGSGMKKQYLDAQILIDHLNNTGASTNTQPNFDLSSITTVPTWATHAIVYGRSLVAQAGSYTGGSNNAYIKLSHNGADFNLFSYAAAYGGSGQADRSDDSNTQEVRIRNGNLIGFETHISAGGASGQNLQTQLYLVGFAGYQ